MHQKQPPHDTAIRRARSPIVCAVSAIVELLEQRTLLSGGFADGITVHTLSGLNAFAVGRADASPAPQVAASIYSAVSATSASHSPMPVAPAVKTRALSPFTLQWDALKLALADAPLEFTPAAATDAIVFPLPMPDGTLSRFRLVETSVMEAELAQQFPNIKTFCGQGIDDPSASLRLDYTPLGFHAQVLSAKGSYYIDPYVRNEIGGTYASYYKCDLTDRPAWTCAVLNRGADAMDPMTEAALDRVFDNSLPADAVAQLTVFEGQLRTYRLALAADAEYTAAVGGGTVAGGQAAIVSAMNRINGVYEIELGVRMVLVANNSSLVYTNSGTDPYTNNNGSTMLGQNQSNIDTVIGNANYDIGHVFSTGGGGIAGLGVVGETGFKAWGVTGSPSPTGDAFWIDYVAHEMGHQFGGNHTFNTSQDGNRNASTAYEPGSGSTIMAYAGIVGDEDLQPHSDPYFHSVSIDEIRDYLTGTVPSVGTITNTGNNAPTISAGANYTIPRGTPFQLTASGSDPDGDAITYEWQERDLGAATLLTTADNGNSPLFRDWVPSTSPARVLPQLGSILNGSNQTLNASGRPVEKLFSVARTSHWRVIARDNKPGGGAVATADMTLSVIDTGAAFAVTAPNTATSWADGSSQTVTWNVAGTTTNGINVANVNILLSTDGGLTFPTTLAAGTANDGSESITVPSVATSAARIRVEAIGNIFFDISNANFTVTANIPGNLVGQTFEDRNSNGAMDAGEPAINGVTVFLDSNNNTVLDGGEPSTVAAGAGNYAFNSLASGTYHLREQIPAGYFATLPAGGAIDVAVPNGSTATQNLGNFPFVYNGSDSVDVYEVRQSGVVLPPYSDNFNRATLNGGSNIYTTTATAGDGGASIVGDDILTLTNDASASGNATGVVYTTTPTSAFTGFNQQLNQNTGPLTWTFNIQQGRSNPGGLSSGSYGAAYVLGATNGIFSGAGAGNGYAVAIGNSGSPDPIRLLKFTGGASGTVVTIGQNASQNSATSYWSVKVIYDPSNNQWNLYTRNDGTAFSSPSNDSGYVQSGSTSTDTTYTAAVLTHAGAYWSYSTAGNQTAQFDNINLTAGTESPSSKTEILVGGVVTYSVDKTLLPSLSFNLADGSDTLTVDYANGSPIPTGGVFYDGGAGANDALIISGTPMADAVTLTNAFAGPTAGNININDPATGAQTVEGVTFNGLAGNDSLTVASAPVAPLIFNGGLTITDQDTLNLNAGVNAFVGDLGASTANLTLNIGPTASAAFSSVQHLAGLNISGTASVAPGGTNTIVTRALTVSGQLDLRDNDLILNYSNASPIGFWNGSFYDGITGLIASGRNGGGWDGTGIITSMSDAPPGLTTLGIGEASDLLDLSGSDTTLFSGETVDATCVLIKYTYTGDANLDGSIDATDYFYIDNNISTPGAFAYSNGDFDYDGVIDATDYFYIDSNIAIQGPML